MPPIFADSPATALATSERVSPPRRLYSDKASPGLTLRVGAYAVLMMLLFSGFVLVLSSQWGVGLLLIVIGIVPSGALLISRRCTRPCS